jgi:PERQ amino acid-rich with GYF domain-containing protein
VPPYLNTNSQWRNSSASETRFSKEQLLEIYKAMAESCWNLDDVLNEGWIPGMAGNAGSGSWGRRDDQRDGAGAEICWDHEGLIQPISLLKMTEEEKEVFGPTPIFRALG